MAELDLADIQGFILRGYNLPAVRHFLLAVAEPAAARRSLSRLAGGDGDGGGGDGGGGDGGGQGGAGAEAGPRISSAAPWHGGKPSYCLNVGLTWGGLRALGLPEASLRSFPEEFAAGAVARAAVIGDSGESAPANWLPAFAQERVHAILSLYAGSRERREEVTAVLRQGLLGARGWSELGHLDAHDLPGGKVHFGYRDGISQPIVEGGPARKVPGMQPPAPAGEFLLGHPSQLRDFTYPVPQPDALGQNGSFVAFRVLRQEVAAFAAFLRENAARLGIDEELFAAKVCGRWRSGVPLELSPDTGSPSPPIPYSELNDFDYVPSPYNPGGFDDRHGLRCPVGSHLRRTNPRSQLVAGDDGHQHRLIRRGSPYGPAWDPAQPDDGIERGLLGLFIAVSIKDQFEFLMSQWVNGSIFTAGLGGTKDPLLGDHTPATSKFVLPGAAGPQAITGFPRFVVTRGGAYCFLPSLTALRYLGTL
jgi:Dyp-type peroxidase family